MTIQQRDYRYHRHYETPKERQQVQKKDACANQSPGAAAIHGPKLGRILWESGYDPWTQSVARKAQH